MVSLMWYGILGVVWHSLQYVNGVPSGGEGCHCVERTHGRWQSQLRTVREPGLYQ